MPLAPLPDLDALDTAALKDMVIWQHAQLSSHDAEVERLRMIIARFRRLQFGRKSEKIQREIEQLELQLEDLEAGNAEKQEQTEKTLAPVAAAVFAAATRKPARRPLPDYLPREVEVHEPQENGCPACGGSVSKLGEDVSEILEYVPARFKVVRHVRPKLSCTKATPSCRPTRRAVLLHAASLGQDCWPMFSYRSTPITCRYIARPRSTHAKELNWSVPHLLTGSVQPANY
jgi:Transposase C of IS166 homeodomain/zinc-finger binding domain of transposase IS66